MNTHPAAALHASPRPVLHVSVYGDQCPLGYAEPPRDRRLSRLFPPVLVRRPIAFARPDEDAARPDLPAQEPGWCDVPMAREHRGRVCVADRHLPLLRDLLGEHGIDILERRHEDVVALPWLHSVGIYDPGVLRQIATSPTCLVRYDPRAGPVRFEELVRQTTSGFHAAPILVIARNQAEVGALRRHLIGYLGPRVHGEDDYSSAGNAVTVTTLGGYRRLNSILPAGAIVVLTDATLAFTAAAWDLLDGGSDVAGDDVRPDSIFAYEQLGGRICRPHRRLVGLLPTAAILTPDDERRLYSRFGCRGVSIPAPGRQVREVRYQFLDVYTKEGWSRPAGDGVTAGRTAAHPMRQRLVARVARWIRERDRDGLLRTTLAPEMVDTLLRARTTVVLAPDRYRNDDLDRIRRAATDGTVRVLTVDELRREAVSSLDAIDVVVRVEGGVGVGPLEPVLATPQYDPRPLHVIDFGDQFDGELRGRAERRRAAYRAAGWLTGDEIRRPHLARYRNVHPDGAWWWRYRAAIARDEIAMAMAARPADRIVDPLYESRPPGAARDRNRSTGSRSRPVAERAPAPRLAGGYGSPRPRATTPALVGTGGQIPPFAEVFTADNLLRVLVRLQEGGGDAPGPDGIRPSDLGVRDAGRFRDLSRRILGECYRPGPVCRVDIMKDLGGIRTLSIASVDDRVVSLAALLAVSPAVDEQFLGMSYGFRAGRSAHQLLADLFRTFAAGNRILVIDDIRTAFDVVPLELLQQDVAGMVPDDKFRRLLFQLAQGESSHATRGIPQGAATSPLLLNITLHQRFDRSPYGEDQFPFVARYADNIVGAARTAGEAQALYGQFRERLCTAGFALKGGPATSVVDLGLVDRDSTGTDPQSLPALTGRPELLGFRLGAKHDRLDYILDDDAWADLRVALTECHERDHPDRHARSVLDGWIRWVGPALVTRTDQIERRIRQTIRESKFRFTDQAKFIGDRTATSRLEWTKLIASRTRPSLTPGPLTTS